MKVGACKSCLSVKDRHDFCFTMMDKKEKDTIFRYSLLRIKLFIPYILTEINKNTYRKQSLLETKKW